MSKHEWMDLGEMKWCRKCATVEVPMLAIIPLLEVEQCKRADRIRIQCSPRPIVQLRLVDWVPTVLSAESECPGRK